MRYGKTRDGKFEYVKDGARVVDGRLAFSLGREQHLKLGEKPVYGGRAPKARLPEGMHWERDGWRETATAFVAKWKAAKDAPATLADYDKAMEDFLRGERAARGYTTREPDAYLSSDNARWAQDARDWVAHRDAVVAYAQETMNAVKSGQREPPTVAEFAAGLPRIEWTEA